MKKALVWFRNDLRLHDHATLVKATEFGEVIAVYVFDEHFFTNNFLGLKKTGYFRAKFLLESVQNLRQNLQARGSDLIIRVGSPTQIVSELAQNLAVDAVFIGKEVTQEETTTETVLTNSLKPVNIDTELVWDSTLYHIRDLPFSIQQLPRTYAAFEEKIVSNEIKVRPLLPENYRFADLSGIDLGELPSFQALGYDTETQIDFNTAFPFTGGETAGIQRVESCIKALNGETENTSKLSAWLALGCLSPRKIHAVIEKQHKKNAAIDDLIKELIRRDYFRIIALKNGTRIFKPFGVNYDLSKKWLRDTTIFETWKEGKTGINAIDASMHELSTTGYIPNRERQYVAHHLAKVLKIDWTWGASYFESQLIDYDVCSNWGNWNCVSGVGNDLCELEEVDSLS